MKIRFPYLLYSAGALLLSACALTTNQKTAVAHFSSSAAVLGDLTSSELVAMRNNAIEMTKARLLLAGMSKDDRLAGPDSQDRGFEVERVEAISGATRALSSYGKSLAALVGDEPTDALNSASYEFVASLGNVPGAKDKISDAQMSAIGSAVQDVGGFWVEWKKKKALVAIVANSQQVVGHLCDLLVRDFDEKNGWVGLQLLVLEAPLLTEVTNTLYDSKTFAERSNAEEALRLLQTNRMIRTEILRRVRESALAMKRANASLGKSLESDGHSMSEIRDFATRASELRNTIAIIVSK